MVFIMLFEDEKMNELLMHYDWIKIESKVGENDERNETYKCKIGYPGYMDFLSFVQDINMYGLSVSITNPYECEIKRFKFKDMSENNLSFLHSMIFRDLDDNCEIDSSLETNKIIYYMGNNKCEINGRNISIETDYIHFTGMFSSDWKRINNMKCNPIDQECIGECITDILGSRVKKLFDCINVDIIISYIVDGIVNFKCKNNIGQKEENSIWSSKIYDILLESEYDDLSIWEEEKEEITNENIEWKINSICRRIQETEQEVYIDNLNYSNGSLSMSYKDKDGFEDEVDIDMLDIKSLLKNNYEFKFA